MPTIRQFFKPDLRIPLPKLRRTLSAPGLLGKVREAFAQIQDTRNGCRIPLVDALMSGLEVSGMMRCAFGAIWQRLFSFPAGSEVTVLTATTYECGRGPEFPEPGQYCP